MRGLHVLKIADTEPSPTAGVSSLTLASAREMRDRGHQVSTWFTPDMLPVITHAGIRRLVIPWFIAWRVLMLSLAGKAPDVVEVHEPLGAPLAGLCRLFSSALPACVVFSHGLEALGWRASLDMTRCHGERVSVKSRILYPLTVLSQARAALALAGHVLVVSGSDRRYLIEERQLPEQRVTCCYTAVLLEPRQASHPGGDDDLRVLYLGSWLSRKGTRELTRAWAELARVRSRAHLTVAGTGGAPDAAAAVNRLERATCVPEVPRDHLEALLAEHDVFILPSWFEGMSLAMLEAAAAGLACVVTHVAGSVDVFPDSRSDGALTVAPGDSHGLCQALVLLADSPELRRTLGARASDRARSFTLARCVDLQLDAYAAALERVRPIRRPAAAAHRC